MKRRIGIILAAPFIFLSITIVMIMDLPIWLFTGRGFFSDMTEILTNKFDQK